MNLNVHDRIEAIAGAIALGEASDDDRREYREHISVCAPCLQALGGEHEIERIASTVSEAREAEVWEPQLRDVVATHTRRRARTLRWGTGIAGFALAASFGVHALFAAGMPRITVVPAQQSVPEAVTHVSLDQPEIASKPVYVAARPQRLIVTHNVVQIARAPLPASASVPAAKDQSKPSDLVSITVHPDRQAQPEQSKVPVWRRNSNQWRTVARTTTTSITETAPQTLTHSAEFIQVAPSTSREVAPLGGDTAINPQPPMIAYDEGADGTTVFEVLVDEHGGPTRCVITKSSGYPVLDDAVCKAAMKARYSPKMVDGRTVPGVYHDAFTFHMTDQNNEGVPSTIPAAGNPQHAQYQITPGAGNPGPGGRP